MIDTGNQITDTQPVEQWQVVAGKDDAGESVFSVLVKRTYDIQSGQRATRAEKSLPILIGDEYYDDGDPKTCSVKYESDTAPYKIATDVVVIGKAYAPSGRPVPEMDVSVSIADCKKNLHVIGDRNCIFHDGRDPSFTDPVEFAEMELRYERAYGGCDLLSSPGLPFFYPRNHIGKGLALSNIAEVIDGLPVPNIEDAFERLTPERVVVGEMTRWNQQPLPQGFGWFQKTWYPRCSFVGSVPGFVNPDEVMREEKLGLVPKQQIALARQFRLPSFDIRFNNGGSLGLVLPFLAGNETVMLDYLTKDGKLEFMLPDERPAIRLDLGHGWSELEPVLHTVCLRPEDMQVDLVWRGAQTYPGVQWVPEMKTMEVDIQ